MDGAQCGGESYKECRLPSSLGLKTVCEYFDLPEKSNEGPVEKAYVDLPETTERTFEPPFFASATYCGPCPMYAEERPRSPKPLYLYKSSDSDVSSNESSSDDSCGDGGPLQTYTGFRRMHKSVPDLASLDTLEAPELPTPHVLVVDNLIAKRDRKHEDVRTLIISCSSEDTVKEFLAAEPIFPKLQGWQFDAVELFDTTKGSELNYACFFAAHSKTLLEVELNTIRSVWEIQLLHVEMEKRLIENITYAMINLPNLERLSIRAGLIPSSLSPILPTCSRLKHLKLQCYKFDDATETIPGALIEVFEFEEASCAPRRLTLNLVGMRSLQFLRVRAFRHVIVSDFNPWLKRLELAGISPMEISFQGDCSRVDDLSLSLCRDSALIVVRSRRGSSKIALPLVLPKPFPDPRTQCDL